MLSKRNKQVGELLKTEISRIIRSRLNDPRVGFVTITDVIMSKDLRLAKVYISVLGETDEDGRQTVEALEGAHAFIQNELRGRIRLRFLPVLRFYLDESWEKRANIDRIIHQLHTESNDAETAR